MEYDVLDAEKIMLNMSEDGYLKKDKYVINSNGLKKYTPKLSNSQIRKFLTAVNVVRNKVDSYRAQNENTSILSGDLVAEVEFLKVDIVYQAAKDTSGAVKAFIKYTKIDAIIKDIGNDVNKFNKFCKYVEALVAFHKFYGGKE